MYQPSTAVEPIFYWGGFLLTASWGVNCLQGTHPFENHFYNWNRSFFYEALVKLLIPSQFCFGWSIVESGTSIMQVQVATAVLFFCKCINIPQLWNLFCIGVVFSILVLEGVNSSEGLPPLRTFFAIEIDAVLMKQLWSLWFQVNSVLVGPWWSLAHQ